MKRERFRNSKSATGGEAIIKRNSTRLAKSATAALDDTTRKVLQNKYLVQLESDNFAETDVNEVLVFANKDELNIPKKKQRKRVRAEEIRRLPLQLSLNQALQDGKFDTTQKEGESPKSPSKEKPQITYMTINAAASTKPKYKLCVNCGTVASYPCKQCESYYCSLFCQNLHKETRCLKWTA